jgi:prophage DNA circulation protein
MPDWNLIQGKYNGFSFDTPREAKEDPAAPGSVLPSYAGVQETTESFGKRLQIDRLPGAPGARVKGRGRHEERIRLRTVWWGPNYQARWFEFKNLALLGPGPADLEHPVWGTIRCDFLKGTTNSIHSKSVSVIADLEFVEDATELVPIASPELVLAQAQAAVERSSSNQAIDMFETMERLARTTSEIRIQATTFTQGIFTLLDSYSLLGTDVTTGQPVATCPELVALYEQGADSEAAKQASIAERRTAS